MNVIYFRMKRLYLTLRIFEVCTGKINKSQIFYLHISQCVWVACHNFKKVPLVRRVARCDFVTGQFGIHKFRSFSLSFRDI